MSFPMLTILYSKMSSSLSLSGVTLLKVGWTSISNQPNGQLNASGKGIDLINISRDSNWVEYITY